ncbi:hypothetical protein NC652_026199 [Populus alba x Populus x berolinensis]|nr:hypothetical protein NC652_026199 [Populus alba x Populus x berolinensis]
MKVHGSDLRVTALDTWMMGKVNRERLAVYLGELQRKEDTNDRYVAALRGETFTRNPYARIQSIPKRNNTEADKEQKLDNDQRKQFMKKMMLVPRLDSRPGIRGLGRSDMFYAQVYDNRMISVTRGLIPVLELRRRLKPCRGGF